MTPQTGRPGAVNVTGVSCTFEQTVILLFFESQFEAMPPQDDDVEGAYGWICVGSSPEACKAAVTVEATDAAGVGVLGGTQLAQVDMLAASAPSRAA